VAQEGSADEILFCLLSSPVAVQSLYAAGARKIVVANLCTIGCYPIVIAKKDPTATACNEAANALARQYNAALATAIQSEVRPSCPGAAILELDYYAIFNAIQTMPAAFGTPTQRPGPRIVTWPGCHSDSTHSQHYCLVLRSCFLEHCGYGKAHPLSPLPSLALLLCSGFTSTLSCCGAPLPANALITCGSSGEIDGKQYNSTTCPNPKNHIYWDFTHPSQATANIIAKHAWNGNTTYMRPFNVKKLVCPKEWVERVQ